MGQKTGTASAVPTPGSPGSDQQTQPLAENSAGGLEPRPEGVQVQRRGVLGRRKPAPDQGGSGDDGSRPGDPVVYRTEPPRRRSRLLTAAIAVGVLIVAGALALNLASGALDRLNPFKGLFKNETIDRSGPAVLKQINDLGQFEAASGYYELVVDVEKDVKPVPAFLAGSHTLFIAAGTVDSGVNLSGLGDGAVKVNGDRTHATITLPAPTLSAPSIDYDRSYVYSQDRGLFDRVKGAFGSNTADTQKLYALASQRLSEAATETDDLRTRAEKNTRTTLQGLLQPLGFTQVTVNFTE
jgi:hypothetical protein